ncbi:MAG: glycosyltransferase [Desulfovibrio sp.]|jgi:glycosyltransferase involved in cell wall biosynthesis|nr:glycosyltransferase [Desulfovibrio sp.]
MLFDLSIVIPTCNRESTLNDTLQSLIKSKILESNVECIVIDNGSTDTTRAVVKSIALHAPFPIRYVYEPCPGLHVGRNLGAVLAKGDILSYLDDDVFVQHGWAEAVRACFDSDPAVMIAGGPCRPHWEGGDPPAWIERFRQPVGKGWTIPVLSLIDLGSEPHAISGLYVYGCNFSIRRQFVLDSGGFHPDGMPKEFLRYRGDGESAMGMKVDADPGLITAYAPDAVVLHRVPVSRLSRQYIQSVVKRNGIGQAYTAFRECGALSPNAVKKALMLGIACMKSLSRYAASMGKNFLDRNVDPGPEEYYLANFWAFFHFLRICISPELRKWVGQKSYLPGSPCPYASMTKRAENG